MNFVFTNKNEFEADIITEILKFEGIYYTIETKITFPIKIYDIKINTSYEHFLFVKNLLSKKIEPYLNAEKCYALPSKKTEENKEVKVVQLSDVIFFDNKPIQPIFDFEIKNEQIFLKQKKQKNIIENFIERFIKRD